MRLTLNSILEEKWRSSSGTSLDDTAGWSSIRQEVLSRDKNQCFFCGFSYQKWMEVHHIGGNHEDNSSKNLVTLCPLCHSCFHIGLAGVQKRGRLLELRNVLNQEKLNFYILSLVLKTRSFKIAEVLIDKLPLKKDHGSDGLMFLANLILERKTSPPKNLVFVPFLDKYKIFQHMVYN